VVFGIVATLVGFAAVRYRRRSDDLPRQRSDAPRLELAYALVLAGIVAVLATATFRTESRVDRVSARAPVTVDVTASKWKWRFSYPQYGFSRTSPAPQAPATLTVPIHTTVQFELTSLDVIHSFFVPGLRFKRDAFPDRNTRFDLVFDRAGYTGTCAEFCGLHHADMRFNVEALPAGEFLDWARAEREGGESG
jgi:cytochrome c oxidase subunit 2